MKSPSPASDSPQPLSAFEGEEKEADELALPYPYCTLYVKKSHEAAFASYSEGDAAFPIDGKAKQAMETLNTTDFHKSDGKGKQAMENPKKENGRGGEEEIKVWNLRPRVAKSNTSNNATTKKTTKSARGKKEKLSVAISLTKEEIEDDIFALTGAKPSRRPKKRPKNVQKQLDAVSPGLWLHSISADSYKVSENSPKH